MSLEHRPWYSYNRYGRNERVEACSNCVDDNYFPVPRKIAGHGLVLVCPRCGKHVLGERSTGYQDLVERWNEIN